MDNNELKVTGKNESDYSTSFYIKLGMRIALAEMTVLDKELALSYLELGKITSENKKIINSILEQSDKVMFFNRLNVPPQLRGNGYGKELLNNVLNYCSDNNILLINTANNYGDMGQKNLISFYEKAGMKLIEKEGLLIFHKELKDIQIVLQSKQKKQQKIK